MNRGRDKKIMGQEFIILLRCIQIQCKRTNLDTILSHNCKNIQDYKEIQMENILMSNLEENLLKPFLKKQEVNKRIQLYKLYLDNQIK